MKGFSVGKKKGLQRVKEYADNQVLLIALGAHNDNLKRLEKNWALKSKRAAIKSRSRGKKKPLNTLFRQWTRFMPPPGKRRY